MEIRIYISLKEAEDLVFNKIIKLPISRLQIKQAQKEWSIVVLTNKENLIEYKGFLFVVSGATNAIEIPEQEENLFFNHLRVPKGLIKIADRKYRDTSSEEEEFDFPDEIEDLMDNLNFFKYLRRGLVYCYSLAANERISKSYESTTYEMLNNLNTFPSFQIDFIKKVISTEFYPIKERNDGGFYTEAFKRFNWLGAYLFSKYPGISGVSEGELENVKQWLLYFKDKLDYESLIKAVSNVPEIFFDDFEFIVGYYYAASFFEEAKSDNDFQLVLFKEMEKGHVFKNDKVIFWGLFFQGVFRDFIDYLYFIPSFNEQQKKLELNILDTLFSDLNINANLEKLTVSKEVAIAEYLQLRDGGKLIEPSFITNQEQKEILQNSFSNQNILKVGIEVKKVSDFKHVLPNWCYVDEGIFSLELASKPSEVTFYAMGSGMEFLSDLKIKTKPLSKIIDNNKKALVGIFDANTYIRSLFKVYEWIFKNSEVGLSFKTIVFLFMADEDVEYIQSTEFQNKKLEMESYFKDKFGNNVSLLVKNIRIDSDVEIKRNLKHLLGEYKIKDIELINEHIDDNVRDWIFSINNEYVVEAKMKDYYTYLNK